MNTEQANVMDCREAQAVLDRIKEDPVVRFDDVQEFKARRGWAALCYTSWEDCRKSELLPKETGRKYVKPKAEAAPEVIEPKKSVRRTMDYWFDLARELAEKNGGKVPHNMELRRMGKYTLYRRMKDFPEEFAARGLVLDNRGGRPGNLKIRPKKSANTAAATFTQGRP